ncbi:Hsp20/alpha crystallin family protein [Cupriavidus sp. 2KB_3]|uniref:Hsp20/alpha crystallin family protein n=1 Tax=Cupriavidus TaxID=106589 RepID=UPI0011ED1B1F|nr:Hsp20/alpha crystallin family protein [Cupriavidus campinensis]
MDDITSTRVATAGQHTTQPAPTQYQSTENRPGRPTVTPPVDIVEDARGITLFADLPGVTRENLDVKVHDGHLFIEGEAMVDVPPGLRVQHLELQQPRFARTFAVSPDFDTARIEANLQNGVLRLMIPRREEAKPRRITVHTN